MENYSLFLLRCAAGPLCEEPMKGVAFVVTDWQNNTGTSTMDELGVSAESASRPIAGQLIKTVKDACRRAFQVGIQAFIFR